MHKREIIQTDMEPKYRELFDNLSQEFYDRVLLQSKDQYLNKGFERIVAKWYKDGFDRAFGFFLFFFSLYSFNFLFYIINLFKLYSPAWHCIAGPEFAAYITHEARTLMYFSIQFAPSVKKSSQTVEDDLERRKDAPALAFWRVLLFKAG